MTSRYSMVTTQCPRKTRALWSSGQYCHVQFKFHIKILRTKIDYAFSHFSAYSNILVKRNIPLFFYNPKSHNPHIFLMEFDPTDGGGGVVCNYLL